MLQFAYPAVLRRDEDARTVVSFPDLPEAHTDGKDIREALAEAMDCLGSAISIRLSQKEGVPEPSQPRRGQKLIPVPFWIAGKLGLYLTMKAQRISNSELARRLGVTENVIRRMLDPKHTTSPEKLQTAFTAMGKQLSVGVRDAA